MEDTFAAEPVSLFLVIGLDSVIDIAGKEEERGGVSGWGTNLVSQ